MASPRAFLRHRGEHDVRSYRRLPILCLFGGDTPTNTVTHTRHEYGF